MLNMDGVELELTCPCGFENFERVIVTRRPGSPIVTDFVACVGCRAVYFSPVPNAEPPEVRAGHNIGAIGPPPPSRSWSADSDAAVKRDAAEAAKDYRKPGQHKPPR